MKKICVYLNFSSSEGGIYQYSISILDALFLSDFEVNVLCEKEYWGDTLKKYKNKFRIIPIKNSSFVNKLSRILLFSKLNLFLTKKITKLFNPNFKIFKELNSDLWIFPYPDPISYQLDIPYIISIHDLMHIYEPDFAELSGFLRVYFRNQRFKRISYHAKAILVDSKLGKKQLIESYNINPEKIYPLPFVPPNYKKNKICNLNKKYKQLNLPKKYFFYPAKFWSHKNHLNLLSSLKIAINNHPDMHLVLTGNKNHNYENIKKEIYNLNLFHAVTVLGEIDLGLIPYIYKNATALIMPTFIGPTNIPPLEAIIYGCPMAVSNIYAMPDQLKNSSLYFNPKSIHEISHKMCQLWSSEELRTNLINEGGKLKKEFSISAHKKRLELVIKSL